MLNPVSSSKTQVKPTSVLRYMLQRSRLHIVWLLLILLVLIVLLWIFGNAWWSWFEPMLAFLILGSTLTAWYMDSRQEWEEKLEKRLTVHFLYQGHQVMCCEFAHLAGESDIRQLAQQIGLQMNDGKPLQFVAAEIKVEKHAPCGHQEGERYIPCIKPYDVYLTLTKYPETLSEKLAFKEGCPIEQTIWRYPFVEDGKANIVVVSNCN